MAQLLTHKTSVNIVLLAILTLALVLRYSSSLLQNNLSFGDGGRDIFVAKKMAENGIFQNIDPLSSLSLIPNTPIYYQLIAIFYKIGGINAISLLFILSGVLVVYLTYQIVKLLFASEWLALWAALMVTISAFFINLSATIWPPHIQFSFTVLSLYLTIKILYTHQKKLYWLSLIPLFFTLTLHNSGIPIAFIFSVFMVVDYTRHHWKKTSPFKINVYYLAQALVWCAWLLSTYYHKTINFIPGQSNIYLSLTTIGEKYLSFGKNLFVIFGDGQLETTIALMLILSTLFALVVNLKHKFFPKSVSYLLFALLSLLALMPIVPGAEFRSWYFFLQLFLLFWLLPMAPRISFSQQKNSTPLLVIWIFLFSNLIIKANIKQKNEMFQTLGESRVAAQIIKMDLSRNMIDEHEFALSSKTNQTINNSLEVLKQAYLPASVQYVLEVDDPNFANRATAVGSSTMWSNYLEPDKQINYLLCFGFGASNGNDCLKDIYSGEGKNIKSEYLTSFNLSSPIHIFKLTTLDH